MWDAVKRQWKENKPWIVAVAILLIVNATIAAYMNVKADAMAEAALSSGLP